jgi:hypothetical protein
VFLLFVVSIRTRVPLDTRVEDGTIPCNLIDFAFTQSVERVVSRDGSSTSPGDIHGLDLPAAFLVGCLFSSYDRVEFGFRILGC